MTTNLARIMENDPIPDANHLRLLKRYLHVIPQDRMGNLSFFLLALIKVGNFEG